MPSLTSVSPSSVTAGSPGFTLNLFGANFVSSSTARWNGSSRSTVFVSSAQLTASILLSDLTSPTTANITVFSPGPEGGTSTAVAFFVASTISTGTSNALPSLASVSPSSAIAGSPGFILNLFGANFVSSSTAHWNGLSRSTVFVSSAQLTASIPSSDLTSPTTANLTVFSPGPGGGTSTAVAFFVSAPISTGTPNPVPALASLSPSSATAGSPGFSLNLFGANFISSSTALWNGHSRSTVFVSSTQLAAAILTSDLTAPTTANVAIFTPGPGGGTSTALGFIVTALNPAPTLASLSVSSAVVGSAGFMLNLFGTNFISSSSALWNGQSRSTIFVNSSQLTAAILTSDLATAATANITVFTPAPGGGTSEVFSFFISSAALPPAVVNLSPTSALVGSSSVDLTVMGSNFISSSTVLWNGNPRVTDFINGVQLRATLLPTDLAAPITANIAVFTPGIGTSPAVLFTVTTTPQLDPADSAFLFHDYYAFPSPSRRGHPVTIRLQVGVADSVDVHIFDISGAPVNRGSPNSPQIIDDGNGKGLQYTYDYLWDVSGVGSGIYVFAITAKKAGQADIHKIGKVGVLK